MNRSRLTIAVLLASIAPPLASADERQPPNIVLIVADDLGWTDLASYGSTFYETPHLDALAASGVRFTDAYATCPVCSPSRLSLMTGKYPARTGLTAHIGDAGPDHWRRDTPLKPAPSAGNMELVEVTLAEQFHAAGYATMHAGKWHLGGERHWPEYQGFDVNIGGWSQGGPFGGKQYHSPYGNPRLRPGPAGEYLTDRLADESVRFIQAHRFEPFFLHLSFYQVHVPLVAREDLLAKYQAKLATLAEQDDPWIYNADGRVRTRQDLPVYAAMVEAMDEAVGKVTEALEQTGLSDSTIIVFTSDNGGLATGDVGISEAEGWPTTNAPLRAGKGWLYEGGIRVPMIVRAPDVSESGLTSSRVVTGADVYPTALELAGLADNDAQVTAPNGETLAIDGQSFVAALQGDDQPRGPVYWHYPHYGNQGGGPGAAIRDGDWKLIEWYGPNGAHKVELFNLAQDIGEEVNLAETHPKRRDALLRSLTQWRESLDAKMPTNNAEYVAEAPSSAASATGAEKTRRNGQ